MDKRNDNLPDILDRAVAAWRAGSTDESLSGSARSSLFDEVRGMGDSADAAFVPAVTRAWRWAFLGSVPVVALGFMLMVAGDRPHVSPSRLSAAKVNGQVVFTLANGRTDHVICRSTDPQSFNRDGTVKMARNRYSENATGGPNLVFYRID